jgi:hypothetical protein
VVHHAGRGFLGARRAPGQAVHPTEPLPLIGTALASHAAVDTTIHVSWIVDFTVELPALLIVGILLWRRTALGHITAPGLLLQGSLLNGGYALVLIVQALIGVASIDASFVAIVFVIGAFSFILPGSVMRAAASSRESEAIGAKGVRA